MNLAIDNYDNLICMIMLGDDCLTAWKNPVSRKNLEKRAKDDYNMVLKLD